MKIEFTEGAKKDMERLFSSRWGYAIPRWFDEAWVAIKDAWARAFHKYHDNWWWNMHYELTEAMVFNLKRLKKEGIGYPGQFSKREEWEAILQEMIDGFEAAKRIEEGFYGENQNDIALFEKGMVTLQKYYFNLWD